MKPNIVNVKALEIWIWIIKSTMQKYLLIYYLFAFFCYINILKLITIFLFLALFPPSLLISTIHFNKQQLSTLSEGDSEPTDATITSDTNRISVKGNSSLQVQTGRNEILLGDQLLRQEQNRYIIYSISGLKNQNENEKKNSAKN